MSTGRNGDCVRTHTYCIVPRDLVVRLCDHLAKHWCKEVAITVLAERRADERRQVRRRADRLGAPAEEQRLIRSRDGRRAGDRRALTVRVAPPQLPPRARRCSERLVFVERVEMSQQQVEDVDTDRAVARAQVGERSALELLYRRYFDRVFSYAQMLTHDYHEAEDVTQQVFASVIGALPRYEIRPDAPFRAWLFCITRNTALTALRHGARVEAEEPAELERRVERAAPEDSPGTDWLTDSDLRILVSRLPLAQRQALILRYALELSTPEIAAVLDRSPTAVRLLQHRALGALEERLSVLRQPRPASRVAMRVRVKPLPVLGWRRFALASPSRPLKRDGGIADPGLERSALASPPNAPWGRGAAAGIQRAALASIPRAL